MKGWGRGNHFIIFQDLCLEQFQYGREIFPLSGIDIETTGVTSFILLAIWKTFSHWKE